jgi:ankyrin repeat protein
MDNQEQLNNSLIEIVKKGDLEQVKSLIEQGADIPSPSESVVIF